MKDLDIKPEQDANTQTSECIEVGSLQNHRLPFSEEPGSVRLVSLLQLFCQ